MKSRLKFPAAAALLVLAPGISSAQFVSGIGVPGFAAGIFPGGYPIPNPLQGINRAFNPVQFPRGLAFNSPYISASGSFGPFAFAKGSRNLSIPTAYGTVNATRFTAGSYSAYYRFYNRVPYTFASSNKYIPGGSSGGVAAPVIRPPAANQAMIGNAQAMADRNAAAMEGRKQVFDQWAFEKIGVQGVKDPALANGPPELRKALSPEGESDATTGESLNTILVASLALEKKAKAAGVILPPELLADIRFGGSPAAEALNTLHTAGKLPFPSLFDLDKMRSLKDDIEKNFALVADTAGTGKAVDQNRVARLMEVVQRARDRVAPVARDLPFEDAIAARRFLNDLDNVAKVLRDGANAGLLNTRWATEGTTVPDLVKHMAKYKLLFGPAPRDGAEAYAALHRGLSAYHAALNQPKQQ